MAQQYPDVIPMIDYEDAARALEWLARAFGFVERMRMTNDQGRIDHAEMQTSESGVIMLASPLPEYQSPKSHRQNCSIAAAWSKSPWVIDGVLVYVRDVDAHYRQAKEAGATILSEPEGGFPAKRYRAEDLEGHRWMFMERS